ncbi:hypothetical protein CRUP_028252 [Coryphaenoides rupestris]|nr:hypothetical protein CRUP_028252 [Coryphaenoides rupestris]
MSWWGQDFPPEKKEGLLRDIAWMISERECFDKNDAKVIIVHKDYYDYIRTAPFSQGPPASEASKESSAREKVPGVSQHTVDREPALPVVGQYCESLMDVSCKRMCAIVECSCEEQTPYYLCVACGNILSRGLVLLHIQSSRHVRQYMGVVWAGRAGDLPAEFLQRARELVEQNHDEPGTMQRIPLPLEEFNRIRTMTFDEALSRLHTISRNHSQSELLTCVTSKPRPGT